MAGKLFASPLVKYLMHFYNFGTDRGIILIPESSIRIYDGRVDNDPVAQEETVVRKLRVSGSRLIIRHAEYLKRESREKLCRREIRNNEMRFILFYTCALWGLYVWCNNYGKFSIASPRAFTHASSWRPCLYDVCFFRTKDSILSCSNKIVDVSNANLSSSWMTSAS